MHDTLAKDAGYGFGNDLFGGEAYGLRNDVCVAEGYALRLILKRHEKEGVREGHEM